MRTLSAKWFETTVRHEQVEKEDGHTLNSETLVVDAETFAEAEKYASVQVANDYPGLVEVTRMSIAQYNNILMPDTPTDEGRFYHARLSFSTIDERTGRERKTLSHILVQATDIENARYNIKKAYDNSLLDYEIKAIAETNISEIITQKDE